MCAVFNINKCYAERVAVEGEARDEGEDAHAALAAAVVCCGDVQIASKVHVMVGSGVGVTVFGLVFPDVGLSFWLTVICSLSLNRIFFPNKESWR